MRSYSSDIWFGWCMGGQSSDVTSLSLWCCGWQTWCIIRKCECQRLVSYGVVYRQTARPCSPYTLSSCPLWKWTDDLPHTWFTPSGKRTCKQLSVVLNIPRAAVFLMIFTGHCLEDQKACHQYVTRIILYIIHQIRSGSELRDTEGAEGKREEREAEWSDGNKFTLCLALVCRVRSITECLPALMGNGRLTAKFPLRCCGHPSPHTHTHTQSNASTIIYTDMHVHTLPNSHLSACVCVCTHSCTQLTLWHLGNQQAMYNNSHDKSTQSCIIQSGQTWSRNLQQSLIMYESGSMISTSAKPFPSIFQFEPFTVQKGFFGHMDVVVSI